MTNPDDNLIEPCSACEKPVIVFTGSIIFTRRGMRWSFCNHGCFIRWSVDEGYCVEDCL